MKRLILILMLFSMGLSYGQAPDVRVYPYSRDAEFIIGTKASGPNESSANGLLIGSTARQNGTVVSLKGYDGGVTLWFLGDTTGASVDLAQQSDSSLTVTLELKNKALNVWGGLYSETTAGITKLDTVERLYINTGGTSCPYMVLAKEDSWAVADSARFSFQIGTLDSLNIKIVMQGF